MSALSRLFMAIGSAILAWFIYLQWFYDYAKNLSWFPYIMGFAIFSMFLMFLKNIRRGEVGHLEFFGADMEREVRQGWYWPPSIAPFLQGIDLTFGFDIVNERFSTLGSIGGNPNIYHYHEQRLPLYNVRVNSGSFLRANLDRGLNLLFASIFSIRDTEGRVRYYKVGAILYVLCWIVAFIGNIGNHATQLTNQAVNTVSSAIGRAVAPHIATPSKFTSVIVQLETGNDPVWPDWELFVPTRERGTRDYEMIEGKKYLIYSEPTPDSVDTVRVDEPACIPVPVGRKVYFRTTRPPIFAANMDPTVEYVERFFWFDHTKYLDPVLTKPVVAPWTYMRENWNKVETNRHNFLAQAKMAYELPEPTGGGLVCF
jgi:hypothetical protein